MISAIRVVVVDTSLEDRLKIQEVLSSDPEISVVGMASDGRSAVELVFQSRPKVVVFGLGVEGSDCYYAVRKIMAHRPTAILLLANPSRSQGELVAYLLAAGALDAMERPYFIYNPVEPAFVSQLLDRIKLLARVPVITHIAGKLQTAPDATVATTLLKPNGRAAVAIVASTGGPMALTHLLSALPGTLPAPVLVAQHLARGFVEGMVDWFRQCCSLEVRVARNGDMVEPGVVLVAPGGCDMSVSVDGFIELDGMETQAGAKPVGNKLFRSVAEAYGAKAIGVVLTGMGDDGTSGAASIKRAGGRVIAQDQSTSAIFGMPAAAIRAGVVDEVLPLGAISRKLVEWIDR